MDEKGIGAVEEKMKKLEWEKKFSVSIAIIVLFLCVIVMGALCISAMHNVVLQSQIKEMQKTIQNQEMLSRIPLVSISITTVDESLEELKLEQKNKRLETQLSQCTMRIADLKDYISKLESNNFHLRQINNLLDESLIDLLQSAVDLENEILIFNYDFTQEKEERQIKFNGKKDQLIRLDPKQFRVFWSDQVTMPQFAIVDRDGLDRTKAILLPANFNVENESHSYHKTTITWGPSRENIDVLKLDSDWEIVYPVPTTSESHTGIGKIL